MVRWVNLLGISLVRLVKVKCVSGQIAKFYRMKGMNFGIVG